MKTVCEICNWHGDHSEVLTAKNPFDENNEIDGCPQCKTIDGCRVACDEPGCWKPVTCGFPTKTAYRNTCSEHYKQLQEEV